MQFINIVVHSTEDIAFRVFLQQEFTNLRLDDHLQVSNGLTAYVEGLGYSELIKIGC